MAGKSLFILTLIQMTYKTMKVFDFQEGMPEHIKDVFWKEYEGTSNDCYISREVMGPTYYDEDTNTDIVNEEFTLLDHWLLDNGAGIGEYVLINHWW